MSLRVSALVWRAMLPGSGTGTQKLVAARLADFADDDGGRVFPSNARLCRECGLSERAVREAIRALESAGVLVLVAMERPGQHLPREYRFDLDALARLDDGEPADNKADGKAGGTTCRAIPTTRGQVVPGADDQGAPDAGRQEVPGGTTCRVEPPTRGHHVPDQGAPNAPEPLLDPPRVGVVESRVAATSAAKAIIRAFDNARAEAYGEQHRRPFPHGKDLVVAQRWLAADADADLCEAVFVQFFGTMAERGQPPPEVLAYFDRPIADAIATRNRPMPEGKPHEQHRPVQPIRRSTPENRFQRILDRDLAGCVEDA